MAPLLLLVAAGADLAARDSENSLPSDVYILPFVKKVSMASCHICLSKDTFSTLQSSSSVLCQLVTE